MSGKGWIGLMLALGLASCAGAPTLYQEKLVDLTQEFTDTIPTMPGEPTFSYERDARRREDGRWLSTGVIHGSEFAGTHIEAPMHFAEARHGAGEIPLAQLVGPIRVIDAVGPARRTDGYRVDLVDLKRHERVHGRIPSGAAVLVRTGWDRYWDTPERYFGTPERLRYPGLTPELARALVARKVDIVGIDGPSLDAPDAADNEVHRILGAANIPGLENLTGLDALPSLGATLIALPMKIARGGGAPTRVIAIVP